MRRCILHPLPDTMENLLVKVGYRWHCEDAGRMCYHRRLDDSRFPRFHVYAHTDEQGLNLDLHFDALDSIHHRGNHDQPWAYEGGRVNDEMRRIVEVIYGRKTLKEIYHPL